MSDVVMIPAHVQVELDRLRIAELESARAKARAGLLAVVTLIDNSDGVYGLHKNGDPSPWEELRTGGRFESWLADFDDALRYEEEKL